MFEHRNRLTDSTKSLKFFSAFWGFPTFILYAFRVSESTVVFSHRIQISSICLNLEVAPHLSQSVLSVPIVISACMCQRHKQTVCGLWCMSLVFIASNLLSTAIMTRKGCLPIFFLRLAKSSLLAFG